MYSPCPSCNPLEQPTSLNMLHQLEYPKHLHRQLDRSHCLSHASLVCWMFLFSLTISSSVGKISHKLLTAGLSVDPKLKFQSFSSWLVWQGSLCNEILPNLLLPSTCSVSGFHRSHELPLTFIPCFFCLPDLQTTAILQLIHSTLPFLYLPTSKLSSSCFFFTVV